MMWSRVKASMGWNWLISIWDHEVSPTMNYGILLWHRYVMLMY